MHIKRSLTGPLFLLITGIGLTVFLASMFVRMERKTLDQSFEAQCETIRQEIQQEFALYMRVLSSLGDLHTLSDRIDKAAFDEFLTKGMHFQADILTAFGFAQVIPHDIRILSEQAGSPLNLLEPGPSNTLIRASDRATYLWLYHQNPEAALALPDGLDLFAVSAFKDAVVRFTSPAAPVLVQQVVALDNDITGVYILNPIIYQDAETGTETLDGVTIGLLIPGSMIQQALTIIGSDGPDIQLVSSEPDPATVEQVILSKAGTRTYAAGISIADQTWSLVFEDLSHERGHPVRRASVLVLILGSVISLLLSSQVFILRSRNRKIEIEVKQRTADLEATNRVLNQEMAERSRLEEEMLDISAREQQRLGRDLHDSLGPKLSGGVYLSKALMRQIDQNDEAAGTTAQHIRDALKEAIIQTRRISHGLAPVDLSDQNMLLALRKLTEQASALYGIDCTIEPSDDIRPAHPKSAIHLYQIAQESISNAVRHGKAGVIRLQLSALGPGRGRLTITDDGTGIPPEQANSKGMGLRIMKYRAERIGGTIDVVPGSSRGMEVRCEFAIDTTSSSEQND